MEAALHSGMQFLSRLLDRLMPPLPPPMPAEFREQPQPFDPDPASAALLAALLYLR
jgi:hypothetical protein